MKFLPRILSLVLCLSLVLPLLSCTQKQEPLPESDATPENFSLNTSIDVLNLTADHPNPAYRVRLTDERGRTIAGMTLTLTAAGTDPISATTNEEGVAEFHPSIKGDECIATVSFAGASYYLPSSVEEVLYATSVATRCSVYLRGSDIETVNFARLQEMSVGNVFLHQEILSQKSREYIEEFIAKAKTFGIEIHLWLICLHDNGKFVPPIIEEEGQEGRDFNKAYFETEAEKVQKASSLKGLAGLHFDYIRFEGEGANENRADFYSLKNGMGHGETAITEFVRQMTEKAKAVNPALVFSAAIMPEYADLIPKYGQDLSALAKYFSFFVPMTYAGNYEKDAAWITECVRMLRQEFPDLSFRPAVLSYRSDKDFVSLTEEQLREQLAACWAAGANGVTLFYYKEGVTTIVPLSLA